MSQLMAMPFSTIVEALVARADVTPRALAYVVDETDRITYGALRDDALRMATALSAQGLGRGERCALVLPTGLDFIRVLYATQILGAIPVALSTTLPLELVLKRLRLVRCSLAIVPHRALKEFLAVAGGLSDAPRFVTNETVRNAPFGASVISAGVGPDETAYVQFTSGTTGEPRAAMISHRSLIASLQAARTRLDIRQEDVLVSWVPLHHDLGLVRFVFGPLFFGCPVYLLQPSITHLRHWLETASRLRATITGSPDFGYRIAARTVDPQGLDLRALRFATNGGEPVRRSTIERFERRFGLSGVVRPGYGLAEATLGVTSLAPGEPLRSDEAGNLSCGRPFDGIEVRIVDAEGKTLAAGQQGEIWVHGAPVFDGYFDDPAATLDVLRDGWLRTGDIGSLDQNGHLYVLGRKRAMIKRAGVMIPPRDIEDVTDRVEGVRFSAAIGHRQAHGSTEDVVVIAEIRPESASTETQRAELAGVIASRVTRAIGFSPREVILVSPRTIPRTRNGKIQYDELRRLYTEGELGRHGAILHGRLDRD